MNETLTFDQALSIGRTRSIQCVSNILTQREIALIASVSEKEVELFERDEYLHPITRRKIIRAFELIKGRNNETIEQLSKSPILYPF